MRASVGPIQQHLDCHPWQAGVFSDAEVSEANRNLFEGFDCVFGMPPSFDCHQNSL